MPRSQTPAVMTKYVAFLRGINVGRHKRIKMADLKRAFEAAGFHNVATYIASGNVIFRRRKPIPPSCRRRSRPNSRGHSDITWA